MLQKSITHRLPPYRLALLIVEEMTGECVYLCICAPGKVLLALRACDNREDRALVWLFAETVGDPSVAVDCPGDAVLPPPPEYWTVASHTPMLAPLRRRHRMR